MVMPLFLGACLRLEAYNRAVEREPVSLEGNELRGFCGSKTKGVKVAVRHKLHLHRTQVPQVLDLFSDLVHIA